MTIWTPELDQGEIDRDNKVIYRAIADALARDIAGGLLVPGQRLPTQRQLAKLLSVTVGTVGRAYAMAEKSGLISSQVGRGSFVRDPESHLDSDEGRPMIDLGMSLPLSIPDSEVYASTLAQLARRTEIHRLFWHTPVDSTLRHRQSAAKWVSRRMACVESDVLICNGTQSGLLMTLSALTRPGDSVMVESLTFPGMLAAARLLDLKLIPLEMDDQGIVPDSLKSNSKHSNVVYCVPTNQNPTGVTMTVKRRQAISRVIEEQKLHLIEDDVYGLVVDDAPPPVTSFVPDRGFLLCSLSKTLALGLRLAYVRFPDSFHATMLDRLRAIDCFLSPLNVEIASIWIEDGTADAMTRQRSAMTAHRRTIALEILEGLSFTIGPQANHLWLELPETWSAESLQMAARENGVVINPASNFAVDPTQAPNAVRIAIGAALTELELMEGLNRIRRLVSNTRDQRPHY